MEHRMSAAKYFGDMDDANTEACYNAAIKAGHTQDEADNCDDGSVKCPDCPWKEKLNE